MGAISHEMLQYPATVQRIHSRFTFTRDVAVPGYSTEDISTLDCTLLSAMNPAPVDLLGRIYLVFQ